MQIVEAHWEKRNLGKTCFEIAIEPDDTLVAFNEAEQAIINENGAEYLVVKTPTGLTEFLHGLPSLGYTFLEASFRLTLKRSQYACPKMLERLDRGATTQTLSQDEDVERVYNEIRKSIFTADRVTLDGHFSNEITDERYVNWISDVMQAGGVMCEVNVGDDAIGFFVLQPVDTKRVRGILTGLYDTFSDSGLGGVLMKKLNDFVWDQGYSLYEAHVASNNLAALRSNLIFGAQIDEISYTYSKLIETT